MSGSLFLAGLELWVAARTDTALREALVPAERAVGQGLRRMLGAGGTVGRDDLEVLLAVLRGLAVTGVLRRDPRAQERVLAHWVQMVTARRRDPP
jgi:hypothetical protein